MTSSSARTGELLNVRQEVLAEVLAPHVQDDDLREYIQSIVEEWDVEESDFEAFGELLVPLLEGEGCGQPAAVVGRLWDVIEAGGRGVGPSTATFVPLAEGPTLLDSINKIQLHPHDEAKLKQGSKTITEMSETFTVSSEKDLQRLERLEKKQKEKQLSAYVQHRRQMEETMGSKQFRKMRFVGGPAVRDLCLESISVSNGGAELISDCDVTLVWGRKYGLVGRNGAGKSTFLRALSGGEIKGVPSNCQVLHVEQEIAGGDETVLDCVLQCDAERIELLAELKRREEAEEEEEEEEDSAELLERLHAIDAYGAEAHAATILSGLQFTPEMQLQSTRSLSGGWRMRVALARALFVEPDVLLLDEPTNHLDLHAVLWLESFLKNKWAKTVVIVSHARTFLNEVCTDVIHLSGRKLTCYRGNYEVFVKTAEERSKSKRMEIEARQRKVDHMQQFVDKWRCNANRAKLVQSRIKAINRLEDEFEVDDFGVVVRQEAGDEVDEGRRVCFDFPVPEDIHGANMKVSFSDVDFSYDALHGSSCDGPGEKFFAGLNFGLHSGSKVILVGSNGAGKSTLLNLISGKLQASSGVVERSPKLRIAAFSQHHVDGIDLSLTPLEYFLSTIDNVSRKDEERVRAHLSSFGIDRELSEQAGWTLSGGQKSRVGLARICWDKPHFLLLDEPSNHLDMESIDGLLEGLLAFSAKGGGLLMVSHDEYLIDGLLNSGEDDERGELWSVELRDSEGGGEGGGAAREVRVLDADFAKYKRSVSDR